MFSFLGDALKTIVIITSTATPNLEELPEHMVDNPQVEVQEIENDEISDDSEHKQLGE